MADKRSLVVPTAASLQPMLASERMGGVRGRLAHRLSEAVLEVAGAVPGSTERSSTVPADRAAALSAAASKAAATVSASAALVPGPLGLLSLLPDIVGVWRIQAQLVADIAAVYGKTATLTREQMLYCLFRHLVSQGLRDIVVRAGERFLVRRASLAVLQSLAARIGIQVGQRAMGKAIARFAPLVGAAGVAAYAYRDTRQVAQTAVELFSGVVEIEGAVRLLDVP